MMLQGAFIVFCALEWTEWLPLPPFRRSVVGVWPRRSTA